MLRLASRCYSNAFSEMTESPASRQASAEHRVTVLKGILEDLPKTSESTEVLLEEIQQARIRAEYFGRLLRQKDER